MRFFTVPVWALSLEVDFLLFFHIGADSSILWCVLSLLVLAPYQHSLACFCAETEHKKAAKQVMYLFQLECFTLSETSFLVFWSSFY